MRTTVTIDADLAERLREQARRQRISFKEALNRALRAGLTTGSAPGPPYRLATQPMRLRPGVNLDKALALAGALEDEEIVRKLELRK